DVVVAENLDAFAASLCEADAVGGAFEVGDGAGIAEGGACRFEEVASGVRRVVSARDKPLGDQRGHAKPVGQRSRLARVHVWKPPFRRFHAKASCARLTMVSITCASVNSEVSSRQASAA